MKWLYGFIPDTDGFDIAYAKSMPQITDENSDVIVDVSTSRSALLHWGVGIHPIYEGIILFPTNTTMKLRIPFDSDIQFQLFPYPDFDTQTHPESFDNEIWEAKINIFHAPRPGQIVQGDTLIHRIAPNHVLTSTINTTTESVVKHFTPRNTNNGTNVHNVDVLDETNKISSVFFPKNEIQIGMTMDELNNMNHGSEYNYPSLYDKFDLEKKSYFNMLLNQMNSLIC